MVDSFDRHLVNLIISLTLVIYGLWKQHITGNENKTTVAK